MGPCIENELSKCVPSGLTNFIDKETEGSTRDLPNSIQIAQGAEVGFSESSFNDLTTKHYHMLLIIDQISH